MCQNVTFDVTPTYVRSDKEIKKVATFKYLVEDDKTESELDMRISAGSKLYGAINRTFLGKSEVPHKTKLASTQTCILGYNTDVQLRVTDSE